MLGAGFSGFYEMYDHLVNFRSRMELQTIEDVRSFRVVDGAKEAKEEENCSC